MFGKNANGTEPQTGNMIIWGIGFVLILLLLCAAIYMFIMKVLMKKGKNEEEEEPGKVELVSVKTFDSSDREASGAFKGDSNALKTPRDLAPFKITSVEVESEILSEKEPSPPKQPPQPAPRTVFLSKEELSSRIETVPAVIPASSVTLQGPQNVVQTSKNSNPSAEKIEKIDKPINIAPTPKAPAPILNSKEKMPESMCSETSGYQMSSQRSEVNNFNMNEAGRTPPIESRVEMIELGKKDSLTIGEKIGKEVGSSETAVSMTTPPIGKKK